MDIRLLGSLYMGWALGWNHAANVFGTAVSSYMVKHRTAVILAALFVLAGALFGGGPGIRTLSGLTAQTGNTAFIISVAAAITVTLMSFVKLPVSTSQAVVGAIMGIGIVNRQIETGGLIKVFICWITTPLGAAFVAVLLYLIMARILREKSLHFIAYDKLMRKLLILAGIYGAYSLGANNAANVTGVFYQAGIVNINQALLIGGVSIALGALTCGREIMFTIGRRIIPVDAFSAFIAVLAHSVVLHIYAQIGVPVSSSQAIVGAVLGIGLLKGVKTVNKKAVLAIFSGWFLTPFMSAIFCLALYFLLNK